MVEAHCCFIKQEYFDERPNYVNMLDSGNAIKQSKRTHVCVLFRVNNNFIVVPLRNNLGEPVRKFGRIGFPVPSLKRPNAGLDYRYSLVIDNIDYIEYHKTEKLPQSQYNTINVNYNTISKELSIYIKKYVKSANKNRHTIEPLFKMSSLINFHTELGIHQKKV